MTDISLDPRLGFVLHPPFARTFPWRAGRVLSLRARNKDRSYSLSPSLVLLTPLVSHLAPIE